VTASEAVESIEHDAPLLPGPGDRFTGYGVMGLPFRSGHVLALRRFPASTIGPGYTSVWHRDPAGRWTFYSTVAPDLACARYYGRQIHRNVVTTIDIRWTDSTRFRILAGTAVQWDVTLRSSLVTKALNAVAGAIPERAWQAPGFLAIMGAVAGIALGAGKVNLTGYTPNRQRFIANPRAVWLVASTNAVVDGIDIGPAGPVAEQVSLGDFLIPRRGVFAVASTRLYARLD